MKKPTLSNVSSKYGAPMGRRDSLPFNRCTLPIKLHLVRLAWVDGDYDKGGAYWGGGNGDHIYQAHGDHPRPYSPDEEIVECFVRAKSRAGAKAQVREYLPLAKFYR